MILHIVTNILDYQRNAHRSLCGEWVAFHTPGVHVQACESANCDACWQKLRTTDRDHFDKVQTRRRELITKWNSSDHRAYPIPVLDLENARQWLDRIGRGSIFHLVGTEPFEHIRAQVLSAIETGSGTVLLNMMQAVELLVHEELWGYVTTNSNSGERAVNPAYFAFFDRFDAYYPPPEPDCG